MFYDGTMLILLPALLFSLYAQFKVSSAMSQNSSVPSGCRLSGAEVARMLLQRNGLQQVRVEVISGGDHYDPTQRVVRLSSQVYHSNSLTSLGVAAHEVGHALQHQQGYVPLTFRSGLVPLANFGSQAAWPIFLIGMIFGIPLLLYTGIAIFSLAVIFQLVTLPVEYNASARAMQALNNNGLLYSGEERAVRGILDAAALTYLAATVTMIAHLLRYIALAQRRRR